MYKGVCVFSQWVWFCADVNMVLVSGGRDQECDRCGEEAAPVPGGLSPVIPVAPPRRQEGEEPMCWVTVVFDDFPGPL